MCDSFNSNSKMALHILKPHPLLEISRGHQQLMQKITVALGYTSIILLSRVTSFREFNTKKACWGNLPVKQFGLNNFFSEQIRKKSIIIISILVWFFQHFESLKEKKEKSQDSPSTSLASVSSLWKHHLPTEPLIWNQDFYTVFLCSSSQIRHHAGHKDKALAGWLSCPH